MKILFLISNKEEKNEKILKKINNQNNNIIILEKFSFFKILKLIKEKNIEIILSLGNYNIFLKVIEFLYKCPIVFKDEISKEKDLEKLLQHKIAYKAQKDLPVLMYHRVIDDEKYAGVYRYICNFRKFCETDENI